LTNSYLACRRDPGSGTAAPLAAPEGSIKWTVHLLKEKAITRVLRGSGGYIGACIETCIGPNLTDFNFAMRPLIGVILVKSADQTKYGRAFHCIFALDIRDFGFLQRAGEVLTKLSYIMMLVHGKNDFLPQQNVLFTVSKSVIVVTVSFVEATTIIVVVTIHTGVTIYIVVVGNFHRINSCLLRLY